MKSIIALGLLACIAMVVAHDAHSYATIHRKIHSNGGWEGGHGGHGHGKDYFAPADYKYEYGVKDSHTGDHKTASEHRHGHNTENVYKVDTHHPAVYGHGGHSSGHGGNGGAHAGYGHGGSNAGYGHGGYGNGGFGHGGFGHEGFGNSHY